MNGRERVISAAAAVQRFALAHRGLLLAGLLGLLAFAARYGPGALWPTRVDWLIHDDFSTHLLGWLHYRNSPFSLPLGKVTHFIHPLGTTVGFTDSIPLMAVALRPFSALLPAHFQYIGPWMGLCVALQGVVGAWFARRLGAGLAGQLGVGALLVLAPVLFARMHMAHEALSSHFLLVFVLGLSLVPVADAPDARRLLWFGAAACAIAAAIHPVLATMVVAAYAAGAARMALGRHLNWRWALGFGAGAAAAVGVVFAAFGFFGGGAPLHAGGFGHFSANLNTFFNTPGFRNESFSRFFAGLPRGGGQYEGYGYLGLGGMFLVAAGLAAALANRGIPGGARRWLPVLVVALGAFAFSLSDKVVWGNAEVLDLAWAYRPIRRLIEPFRSSGRFLWPLYYLLYLGAVDVLLRLPRQRLGWALLGCAVVLQVLDVDLGRGRISDRGAPWAASPSPAMAELAHGRKHLVMWPPQIHDGAGRGCLAGPLDFQRWSYRAYLLGLTFNSGYVSRVDEQAAQAYCIGLDLALRAGEVDPEALYLVVPQRRHELEQHPGVRCLPEEGLFLCVREPAGTQ